MIILVPCCGKSDRFFYNGRKKQFVMHGKVPLPSHSASGIQCEGNRFYIYDFEELSLYPEVLNKQLKFHEDRMYLHGGTSSVVQTLNIAINQYSINGSIYIKDCDNYFECIVKHNSIAVIHLHEVTKATEYSFAVLDGNGFVKYCIEKPNEQDLAKLLVEEQYVYPIAGGYCVSADVFEARSAGCTYVSEVINNMIKVGVAFTCHWANNYVDYGTHEKYIKYLETL